MEMESKICCFIGNADTNKVSKEKLYNIIFSIVENENVDYFLFGGRNDFEKICYNVVLELENYFYCIRKIFIYKGNRRSREKLLKDYDDVYFLERIMDEDKLKKLRIDKLLIDKSDFCIFCYNEANKKLNELYKYAVNCNKRIIVVE